jgi:heme-degrading monooxygenase HmoA
MAADDHHYVIVEFTVEPDQQERALKMIGDYVAGFLSQQPGFLESTLHRGNDGTSIVHVARWQSEADFKRAGEKAQSHPDLPAMRAFEPRGRGFTAYRRF